MWSAAFSLLVLGMRVANAPRQKQCKARHHCCHPLQLPATLTALQQRRWDADSASLLALCPTMIILTLAGLFQDIRVAAAYDVMCAAIGLRSYTWGLFLKALHDRDDFRGESSLLLFFGLFF